MKRFRNVSAIVSLLAGFITAVVMFINKYDFLTFIWILAVVMAVFYIVSRIICFICDRHITKEEEKAENSKKDADIIKNDVKNNNFTGLSAIIRGQADPGVLPQQHWEPAKPAAAPQQPAPSAAMQIPTAPSVPRWKGSAQNEDMLDPFVTLHSPKLETTKAPEPFRAAASETQLDVEPEFGETKLHSPQDHMAAWNLSLIHISEPTRH